MSKYAPTVKERQLVERGNVTELQGHVHTPDNPPCGFCHTCGSRLPDPDMTWCPFCNSSDHDE